MESRFQIFGDNVTQITLFSEVVVPSGIKPVVENTHHLAVSPIGH